MKVIAIIPALNEGKWIGITVKRTLPYVNKVLVVDDGSNDNTSSEAKKAGAFVIRHEKNKGIGAAEKAGIKYAIKNKYDVCVLLGGDNQDNPKEIKGLLAYINIGYDFVQGSRYMSGKRTVNQPLKRLLTTKIYTLFFRSLIGFKVTDGSNGFRAYKTKIFKDKKINLWQSWLDRYELEPYLYYKIFKEGYKIVEVPVTKTYFKKRGDYTKMVPFVDHWRILKPLIFLKLGIKK